MRRKKESMETKKPASARYRYVTYCDKKKGVDTDLESFPGSNMLVCRVMSSLMPLLECTSPKFGLINLCLFTSSRLMFNCMFLPYVLPNNMSPPLTSTCHAGRQKHLHLLIPNMY